MERRLLALLLLRAGSVVSADTLIDGLWGDEAPKTALKTLQTYVSHLRRLFGDRLRTEPNGYRFRIELDGDAIDAHVFERRVSEGRRLLGRRDTSASSRVLADALAMWRGAAYDELADDDGARVEAARLDELRLAALEDRIDAQLESGQFDGLAAEIESHVAAHPLRERFWALLMRALYASGRQADALQAYQRARSVLVAELGIEPGPELRATEAAVLHHDARLWPSHSAAPPARYTTTDDGLEIAYVVSGSGEVDVVMCLEWAINVELFWDFLEFRPLLERLTDLGRLIIVQRRDTGQSGRTAGGTMTPPEGCVADLDAVLAAECNAPVHLFGWGHGGQVALAYAAARPAQVRRIVALTAYAQLGHSPDHPYGIPRDFFEAFLDLMGEVWGRERDATPIFGPVLGTDPSVLARAARLNRLSYTPSEAVAMQRTAYAFDVRALLPFVTCPVLVIGLTNSITGTDASRALAEMLPDGRYVELPGYFVPSASEAAAIGDAAYDFFTADV